MTQHESTLELLKLRFAGYTTQQMIRLFKFCPLFLSLTPSDKMTNLRQFTYTSKIRNPMAYLTRYSALSISAILNNLNQYGVKYISIYDAAYPRLLKEIYDPPFILFYKGNIELLQHPHYLGVVGSRQSTAYTAHALSFLFSNIHSPQLTIVSGLASGADSEAHQSALQNHLPTIGVLAFGHAHHYPKSNLHLRNEIEEKGLTISEYIPEDEPRKYKFPERNRLISGLSQGVLVTESKERSGAQITIDLALQQNRNVYVLPGSIFQELTKGNLKRAQEGATIVLEIDDILVDYNCGNSL